MCLGGRLNAFSLSALRGRAPAVFGYSVRLKFYAYVSLLASASVGWISRLTPGPMVAAMFTVRMY
jgi:hypothetical protein